MGIAGFDTAWRATGESDDVDRHNLLLGERNVDDAIEALGDSDVSLALMHHPSDWLADFDEAAVSSRISSHFDVLLSGHMHRANPQIRQTPQGTSVISQAGSCYASRRWFNGYQALKIDLAAGECDFQIRTYYDTPRRAFDKATNIAPEGIVRLAFESQKKSDADAVVESFLRHARPVVRAAASRHFTIVDSEALISLDAKDAFIVPPLSRRSNEEETSSPINDDDGKYEEINVDDLLRSTGSYMFSGNRETGKTGLLNYLAVLCAEGTTDRPRIPVIINAATLKSGNYELRKAITTYYGPLPKGFDVDVSLKGGAFLFLVDNYVASEAGAKALAANVEKFDKNRWFVITRPRTGSITRDIDEDEALVGFEKVRVGSLPRKSIRALSRQWSTAIGSSDEDVFDAVMRQLKADGLPRTGYMVTLILWAMQQDKELDRVNGAMLLSNVVDYLLGKADFTQSSMGRLDPRAKEITLEYFAEFSAESGGYIDFNDATSFLSELFKSRRLPFVAADVLTELIRCGILDRKDNIVSFKYRCFEEYFYALRMKSDRDLLSRTLTTGAYPKRGREIEILAGLQRENREIISAIFRDVSDRMPKDIARIGRDKLIAISDRSMGHALSSQQLADLRKKRLTAEQVDDLLDAADKKAIQRQDDERQAGRKAKDETGDGDDFSLTPDVPDVMSVAEFIVSIELLARVVRNSDFTAFEDKEPAARLIVESFGKICVLFEQQLREILTTQQKMHGSENGITERDVGALVYIVTNIISRIVGERFSEQMCSPNVGTMMREICDDRNTSAIERLFIIFLLQALRAKGWEVCWANLLHDASKSGFIMESSIGKMRGIVHWQFLNDKEHEKLHSVIDAAEAVLGWSSAQKGAMIQNLKQVALQAEIRDTE